MKLKIPKNIWLKSKYILQDKDRIVALLRQVQQNFQLLSKKSSKSQHFISKTKVLLRMIRAHYSGKYTAFGRATLLLIVVAVVYFVIPTDIIPDFLPAIGFSDDFTASDGRL